MPNNSFKIASTPKKPRKRTNQIIKFTFLSDLKNNPQTTILSAGLKKILKIPKAFGKK